MITKITYRDEIKKVLLKAIYKGELKPGDRISLVNIAKQLDVSVTPVREALTQLTETRVISYVPNRGFIVTELTEREAIDIYEVIIALETTVLKSTEYTESDISALKNAQKMFGSADSNLERVLKDMEFHQALIAPCTNILLKKLVEDVRIRIFFYELEYMTQDDLKEQSENHHENIIELLQKGKGAKAAKELSKNWKQGVKNILRELVIQ